MAPESTPSASHEAGHRFKTIMEEIKGHIHGPTQGFFDKYFENASWASSSGQAQEVQATTNDKQCSTSLSSRLRTFGGNTEERYVFHPHLPGQKNGPVLEGSEPCFLVPVDSARSEAYGWAMPTLP
ncbi:hypothetical protein FZEAL_5761 [Fusarium zealandicum]|uniref:Uncharacterized protein n=1 Tax=Fusarium zealandicum TaxID=1053134 RepID=A0A8H4UJK1_9HYPO|nr:hypothetical protein FZEAL_5761 [Fusarium zealandicum]